MVSQSNSFPCEDIFIPKEFFRISYQRHSDEIIGFFFREAMRCINEERY